jgi:hypothetical protein
MAANVSHIVERFVAAINAHNVEQLVALMTLDHRLVDSLGNVLTGRDQMVSDVPAAVSFYRNKLGFRLGFTFGDPPTMAGVNLGNVQMFLQQGAPNVGAC